MNRASIAAWWEGLAPRERGILGIGLVVVLLVAVYVGLWEPPASGIRKLRADLPQLRAQDASMRAMVDEVARLRASGGAATAIAPPDRVAAVRRSLERAGLWREGGEPKAGSNVGNAPSAGSTVSTLSVGGTVTTVTSAATARSEPPEVTAETNERVRVRFENIDYGVWIGWLASTEGELSARATRVGVSALAPRAPVGHVRAEAVLDWTQPASSGKAAAAGPRS